MSDHDLKFLILGVSGYVGGSLLKRLLAAYPGAHVTGLLRNEGYVEALKDAGLHEVVLASIKDREKISAACSEADVVINVAHCDDTDFAAGVLEGMRVRFERTGCRPVLVHTSGALLIADGAHGYLNPETAANPFDDADDERVRNIPPGAPHRLVDNMVFAADEEGYVNGWIICPPTIYGANSGPILRDSGQTRFIVETAITAKQGVYMGDGSATWDNVHIDDLLDLYELIIANSLRTTAASADPKPSPYTKFFLVSSGKHTWGELTSIVAQALYERGIIPTAQTRGASYDESVKIHPWAMFFSDNSFSLPTRAKNLGWSPKHLQWRTDIHDDVGRILELKAAHSSL
ncbi:NAD(P)-binding protein [Exidia glandulosa HHB12029]|uniref:NAD(P)-binding protein n=1 Tax=Exidia glandulosa HHB12029 TaxID=1314781 RepID=A0A165B685_EXIGL|nr:NAD(P)-binding protein [Exidia glandulosa HHB12029]